jgi:hypothetical protein
MFLGDDPGTGVRRIAAAAGIIFPLVCWILQDNHFTHTTSIECKLSDLQTIVQGWCFANGFSQIVL